MVATFAYEPFFGGLGVIDGDVLLFGSAPLPEALQLREDVYPVAAAAHHTGGYLVSGLTEGDLMDFLWYHIQSDSR